ncbi:hypothetical protein ALQ94_02247 [Pseudomonas amygdali pv. morsprunorum]|uniref:Uncharacterized protein n=1 Tax=Pseudomonas amygdali pv. morsprunorum TaxID=129138 RepID=A0A3M2WDK4_PSEA0|nr:hypothetical protein ALQ94_02247 [Pseudomonas amygdali pv. morsprunorum]
MSLLDYVGISSIRHLFYIDEAVEQSRGKWRPPVSLLNGIEVIDFNKFSDWG